MRVDFPKCFLLRYILYSFLFTFSCFSCKSGSVTDVSGPSKNYPNTVGDIIFDEQKDSIFILCDISINTVGIHYQGDFSTLKNTMFDEYKSIDREGESGFVIIRFIVNCFGETTMFRVQGMNNQLKEREFDERITNQLVRLIKKSSGWKIIVSDGYEVNYNQYLSFTIVDSELIDIAP